MHKAPSRELGRLAKAVARMTLPTDPANYKATREARGTQAEVAEALGVNRVTVANRELGTEGYPITREAALALVQLPVLPKKATTPD